MKRLTSFFVCITTLMTVTVFASDGGGRGYFSGWKDMFSRTALSSTVSGAGGAILTPKEDENVLGQVIRSLEADNEKLRSRLTRLEAGHDTAGGGGGGESSRSEEELAAALVSINMLRSQLEAVTEESMQLQMEVGELRPLKRAHPVLLEELKQLKAENTHLVAAAESHRRRADDLETENEELRGSLRFTEEQMNLAIEKQLTLAAKCKALRDGVSERKEGL